MLPTRIDQWLRLGSGLGVLLLLAAQEKVLPRWVAAASDEDAAVAHVQPDGDPIAAGGSASGLADAGAGGKPGESPDSPRGAPDFPRIVPDCTAPRTAAGGLHAAWRIALGGRAGIVVVGPQQFRPAFVADAPESGAGWHALQSPAVWIATVAPITEPIVDPAVTLVIIRTGPPTALHPSA